MIRLAEQYKTTSGELLAPQDLFLGALLERTGVFGELFLKGQFDLHAMQKYMASWQEDGVPHTSPLFTVPVSETVLQVIEDAKRSAEAYQQVYINEAHICDALLERVAVEDLLQYSASRLTKVDVRQIACEARDMAVHLDTFATEKFPNTGSVEIRRAAQEDRAKVLLFVQHEYGIRWIAAVASAFEHDRIPVFVAMDNDEVLGFACYDVVKGKQGLFGPMGTARACRKCGVGKALLHHTLEEMRNAGYDYAIIKQAGPVEFYERSCDAVLIPLTTVTSQLH